MSGAPEQPGPPLCAATACCAAAASQVCLINCLIAGRGQIATKTARSHRESGGSKSHAMEALQGKVGGHAGGTVRAMQDGFAALLGDQGGAWLGRAALAAGVAAVVGGGFMCVLL